MSIYDGVKSVFLVGLKGVGVSGLAQLLKAKGMAVSGWDTTEPFFTDQILERAKIPLTTEPVPALKDKPDLAIYSQAYAAAEHPARRALTALKVPQIAYAPAVAALFNPRLGVLVAGSHGKSTTTALIASILIEAGYDPTVLVGTEMLSLNSNARPGASEYFVLEGDEYREVFKAYEPKLLLILNIDWDHPDHFSTPAAYERAFKDLVAAQPESTTVLIPAHEPTLARVVEGTKARVLYFDPQDAPARLPRTLLGEHNRANTAAALSVARALGVSVKAALAGVEAFKGTRRRLEPKGLKNGVATFDDYAHHPTEIRASLEALKTLGPMPLWAVFQPHTFSRTAAFLNNFAASLRMADRVILLPVYGSARESGGGVGSEDLAALIGPKASVAKDLEDVGPLLQDLPKRAIFVTMGAGDVWKVHELLV